MRQLRCTGAWQGARYVWQQLKDFWREGLLSKRQKILIYDALVGSKLLYSLHTLPLKNDLLNKLDVFHLKGLRQVLGLKTRFIDRANTNEKVLKLAEAEINKGRKGGGVMKRVRRISEIIEDRSIQELGEVLRLDNSDPRRMVTFLESTAAPNLPPSNRIGRPRAQWAQLVMQRAWEKLRLYERAPEGTPKKFDTRNNIHLTILLECAQLEDI